MKPDQLRAYIRVITRDLLPPAAATFFSVYLPVTGQFAAWQAPLIAALFGVTLLAPRGNGDEDS